jgi:hypothetical protein
MCGLAARAGQAAQRQVSDSQAIFREMAAGPWEQRASEALRALSQGQPTGRPATPTSV